MKFLALIVVFVVCCIHNMPLAYAEKPDAVNKSAQIAKQPQNLRQLLLSKEFALLNTIFLRLQDEYEKDYKLEDKMTSVLYDFEVNNPATETLLNEWVTKTPNHFAPYLCRGVYFCTRAAHARGAKYVAETSAKEFEDMHAFHRRAIADLQKALELKPTLVHPYAYFIRIVAASGETEIQKQLFSAALELNPYSIMLRQIHIAKLAPRWGGSMAEMQAIVEESRKYVKEYPAMRVVESEIDIELGSQALENSDFQAAIDHLTKAITRGESAVAYFRRGQAYMFSNQLVQAVSDFSKAIALNPSYIYAYEARMSCNLKLQADSLAQVDLVKLLELSPQERYDTVF